MNRKLLATLRSEDDHYRSRFVCDLLQSPVLSRSCTLPASSSVPRTVVQFWDNPSYVPDDVKICMESWRELRSAGFALACFDDSSARRFIADNLDYRYLKAFDACYHPAMRSDYFRLCYISSRGGCYVDADDVYSGQSIGGFFDDGCLKLRPLCYDILSSAMVPPEVFTKPGADSQRWIFYFNNNPLIAPAEDPIVLHALERSTDLLNGITSGELPEIQSTTGPGNLTASLVAQALNCEQSGTGLALTIIPNWDQFATSVWPLSYRADARNWRLSNRKRFMK